MFFWIQIIPNRMFHGLKTEDGEKMVKLTVTYVHVSILFYNIFFPSLLFDFVYFFWGWYRRHKCLAFMYDVCALYVDLVIWNPTHNFCNMKQALLVNKNGSWDN